MPAGRPSHLAPALPRLCERPAAASAPAAVGEPPLPSSKVLPAGRSCSRTLPSPPASVCAQLRAPKRRRTGPEKVCRQARGQGQHSTAQHWVKRALVSRGGGICFITKYPLPHIHTMLCRKRGKERARPMCRCNAANTPHPPASAALLTIHQQRPCLQYRCLHLLWHPLPLCQSRCVLGRPR